MSTTDKIAGLKEILALDPKNSFARYGIAMELANRGEVDAALKEFDAPDRAESRLHGGVLHVGADAGQGGAKRGGGGEAEGWDCCAARTGNRHALSEMQGMLDELDR